MPMRVTFLLVESELKFTSPVIAEQNSNCDGSAFYTTLSLHIPEYSQWDDLDPYCATNIYVGVGKKMKKNKHVELFVLENKARNKEDTSW